MAIEAVIFDLDGTLTQPFLDFDVIRDEMGLDPDGEPILEAMEAMTAAQLEHAHAVLHVHEERAVEQSRLHHGAKETIDALRRLGLPVGVLTRNKRENALRVARKHGLVFDGVLGREDGPAKPDAHGILSLCKRFCVKPPKTLMVGDYVHDLQCAQAAGAIAVLIKSHPNAESFEHYADFTIANLSSIIQIVEEYV
jgi:HAD superfamily hydrolase (TIGR01549 family)